MNEFSHRNPNAKFVKIELRKRDGKGHAIVTCDPNKMASKVKKYQNLGYQVVNIVGVPPKTPA